jgi:glycosyltransferase involved in cell wall biosynthesis
MSERPRVLLLRGNAVNPWDLGPWTLLDDRYDVAVAVPEGNLYDVSGIALRTLEARLLSDRLPGGEPGRLATRALGERFLGAEQLLAGFDVVHAAELGYYYAWQAARHRAALGYKLVLTVWETLPLRDAYRNIRTRRYRRDVLPAVDHFLPVTERARTALLLEGVDEDRMTVCPPGIDVDRFAAARTPTPPADGSHLVLSIGRLVWEKGHQDLIRAIALLRRRGREDVRALIAGKGPDEKRLKAHAAELGVGDRVRFAGTVPYEELQRVYAEASCFVLGSIPIWFWEEQFGMVLAEALAAHLPIVAASSGAIPEVVGDDAVLFPPGDHVALADALESGPLATEPGARHAPDPERIRRFSSEAAAERIGAVYDDVLRGS